MASLIKGQLTKTLTEIVSVEFILQCNVNGIHGKIALKEYKKLFDTLMDAIHANGEQDPEKAIKGALKIIKKRHFQALSPIKTERKQ